MQRDFRARSSFTGATWNRNSRSKWPRSSRRTTLRSFSGSNLSRVAAACKNSAGGITPRHVQKNAWMTRRFTRGPTNFRLLFRQRACFRAWHLESRVAHAPAITAASTILGWKPSTAGSHCVLLLFTSTSTYDGRSMEREVGQSLHLAPFSITTSTSTDCSLGPQSQRGNHAPVRRSPNIK